MTSGTYIFCFQSELVLSEGWDKKQSAWDKKHLLNNTQDKRSHVWNRDEPFPSVYLLYKPAVFSSGLYDSGSGGERVTVLDGIMPHHELLLLFYSLWF